MTILRVTSDSLVMRGGPGRNCVRRRFLPKKSVLTQLQPEPIYAEGSNWLHVEAADGAKGWVSHRFVEEVPSV